eukprot:CAMPEP_0168567416 /NCGR_PEP_ID=MMETSP0413-20121227/14998_1 /TAXON_ID=136452 /ORGANISM="Filamoeba nolandi, Strain NC-AS-23-1" /LENGTH=46 /DNA_ID= /DNA_START= /DNA_END= /DNA_ORIENTATION=
MFQNVPGVKLDSVPVVFFHKRMDPGNVEVLGINALWQKDNKLPDVR